MAAMEIDEEDADLLADLTILETAAATVAPLPVFELKAAVPPAFVLPPFRLPPKVSDSERGIVFDKARAKIYYTHLFPYALFWEWLHPPGSTPQKLEMAFVIGSDTFLRYRSYPTADSLRQDLCCTVPSRFEVGAAYTRKFEKQGDLPEKSVTDQRQLVFDIDLPDYPLRMCKCREKQTCRECWQLIQAAVPLLHTALTDDFGYEKLLWVFSGRKGVHCWVSDDRARKLAEDGRGAIIRNLSLDNVAIRILPARLTWPLERAFDLLEPRFKKLFVVQWGLFDNPHRLNQALGPKLNEWHCKIDGIMQDYKTGSERWEQVKKLKIHFARRIVFHCIYPRLDQKVTVSRGHLLKAPFSPHPVTGKICVPFNPAKFDSFDPDDVPTVVQLQEDLDNNDLPVLEEGNPFSRVTRLARPCLEFETNYLEKFRPSVQLDLAF